MNGDNSDVPLVLRAKDKWILCTAGSNCQETKMSTEIMHSYKACHHIIILFLKLSERYIGRASLVVETAVSLKTRFQASEQVMSLRASSESNLELVMVPLYP